MQFTPISLFETILELGPKKKEESNTKETVSQINLDTLVFMHFMVK